MTTKRDSGWLRPAALFLALGAFILFVLVLPAGLRAAAQPADGNVVLNPGFEGGVGSWTCKTCVLTAGAPAQSGAAAGQLRTTHRTTLAQLLQSNLPLQPNTQYQFTFWARSSGGQDLRVDLLRPAAPATNLGLNQSFDLTTEWQQFTATFTSAGINQPISNARLRFRAAKGKGIQYSIDDVSLVAIGAPPPTPTATPTATPPPGGSELLVFDWNQLVTTAHHGFPWDKPPAQNGNWITPVNYAEGTFHFRAELRHMPSQQDLYLQFCIWQYVSELETCSHTPLNTRIAYRGDTVVLTWSEAIPDMYLKNGRPMVWAEPRHRNGVSVKNSAKDPVSDYSGWNWNGENPADWYPMDMRFTVVVVEKGKAFSGWDNYIP